MRPLRALFFEFTKNSHEMCPLRALSLKFTKSAHKFALFQHHIPCPQKMLDARLGDPEGVAFSSIIHGLLYIWTEDSF